MTLELGRAAPCHLSFLTYDVCLMANSEEEHDYGESE